MSLQEQGLSQIDDCNPGVKISIPRAYSAQQVVGLYK